MSGSSYIHNFRRTREGDGYDYLLKFLVVGDSDAGKQEIVEGFTDGSTDNPHRFSQHGIDYKTTTILLDGKRIKLQLWEASGQGRLCTIFRSYSRGAEGVIFVYDITNRLSFTSIDRWLDEVEKHAPGVPKILVGNRLHQAYNRGVYNAEVEAYAKNKALLHFEVSSLCNFNVTECLAELSRMVLKRNGLTRTWGHDRVLSLQELCSRTIVSRCASLPSVQRLPLPEPLKRHLCSFAISATDSRFNTPQTPQKQKQIRKFNRSPRGSYPPLSPSQRVQRRTCVIS